MLPWTVEEEGQGNPAGPGPSRFGGCLARCDFDFDGFGTVRNPCRIPVIENHEELVQIDQGFRGCSPLGSGRLRLNRSLQHRATRQR
jgi:hypothetical protein